MRPFVLCAILLTVVGCSSNQAPPPEAPPQDTKGQTPVRTALSDEEKAKYAGVYSADLPTANGGERKVILTLNKNLTFSMKFEYPGRSNNIPAFEGVWALNGDLIDAIVNKPAGLEDRYVFKLEGDTLKAVEYSQSEYGEKGLTLKKQ